MPMYSQIIHKIHKRLSKLKITLKNFKIDNSITKQIINKKTKFHKMLLLNKYRNTFEKSIKDILETTLLLTIILITVIIMKIITEDTLLNLLLLNNKNIIIIKIGRVVIFLWTLPERTQFFEGLPSHQAFNLLAG